MAPGSVGGIPPAGQVLGREGGEGGQALLPAPGGCQGPLRGAAVPYITGREAPGPCRAFRFHMRALSLTATRTTSPFSVLFCRLFLFSPAASRGQRSGAGAVLAVIPPRWALLQAFPEVSVGKVCTGGLERFSSAPGPAGFSRLGWAGLEVAVLVMRQGWALAGEALGCWR